MIAFHFTDESDNIGTILRYKKNKSWRKSVKTNFRKISNEAVHVPYTYIRVHSTHGLTVEGIFPKTIPKKTFFHVFAPSFLQVLPIHVGIHIYPLFIVRPHFTAEQFTFYKIYWEFIHVLEFNYYFLYFICFYYRLYYILYSICFFFFFFLQGII